MSIFSRPCKDIICSYNNHMEIAFGPVKRAAALQERGLDFADAALVFAGKTLDYPDERHERLRGVAHHYGWNAARTHGDPGMDGPRRSTARIFDEESQ
jgi:hypothetical protein